MAPESKPDQPKKSMVAQALKRRRQSLHMSLEQVETGTRIRGKYLIKLESGDFGDIPNDVYVRGFVYKYSDFLGLDPDAVVAQYVKERGGRVDPIDVSSLQPIKSRRLVLTPRLLIVAITLLVVGLVVAYLGWQFTAVAAPPKLEVSSPVGNQVIYGSVIEVSGRVSSGADVFVNGSPILTDANGNFSDKLALQDGVNTIKIRASNKLGKSTEISQDVVARLPQNDGSAAAVPAAVFEGVAMTVAMKDAATWLIVEVDGKEAFRGTMLAGTTQLFRGDSRIILSTGNAGKTKVTITNAKVAGFISDPFGGDGEVKRGVEFSKDQQLP